MWINLPKLLSVLLVEKLVEMKDDQFLQNAFEMYLFGAVNPNSAPKVILLQITIGCGIVAWMDSCELCKSPSDEIRYGPFILAFFHIKKFSNNQNDKALAVCIIFMSTM